MVILGSKEKIPTSIMEKMNSLRKDDILADVYITFGNYRIKAHKSVLASASEYFYSCFAGPLKIEDSVPVIDLSSVALDVESVEAVIDFLYTGEIDINDDNLEAILKLTSFLLINTLEELCIEFIELCYDVESFLRYYQLSVDYMVANAENITIRTVKPRFHDWFIHQTSTRELSPFHIKKLIEDYNIFEHCSEIDSLAFLVDWVSNGNTKEHEELACKILDGDVVPIYHSELQSDDETHTGAEEQDAETQSSETDQQIYKGAQNCRELYDNDTQKKIVGQNNVSDPKQDKENIHVNREPQINGKNVCDNLTDSENEVKNELQKPDKQDETNLYDDSVPISDDTAIEQIQTNKNHKIFNTGATLQRNDNDIPKSLRELKNKLQNSNISQEFAEKCQEVIDSRNTGDMQLDLPEATHPILEPDVEHVIIAVAPKKLLKDFNEENYLCISDEEISDSHHDAIFDICVYVPQELTWYYFGEGKNNGKFRKMGKRETRSEFSFGMLNSLCYMSEPYVHMHSLKESHMNGEWTSISFEDLKAEFQNPGYFGRDRNSYRVRIFCRDGENLFLVIKVIYKEDTESKVKFKCFSSTVSGPWTVVSETSYMHESEDADIKDGSFDINVSPDHKELFIVAKGAKIHVFVADLLHADSEMKHSIIEDDEQQPDLDSFWRRHSNSYVMHSGQHTSFVDEVHVDKRLVYRSRKVDLSGNISAEHVGTEVIDTRFPIDYPESSAVKLSERVSDGTSLWLYLSDGKFETSLIEICTDENGFIEMIEHTPPPFTAITLLAAGKVKRKHLVGLKPMKNFLLEI